MAAIIPSPDEPIETAVVNVVSFILSNLVCLADYHICHPIHVRHVATSTRAVLWVISIVGQAFARNAPATIVADVYPKAGTGTRELLYETAANAIVNAVTANHLEGCGSADGKLPHASGLEARLMGEAAHAVTRRSTSLEQANALVLALLERYEHIFESPDVGLPFDQVYDPVTVQPTDEWQEMYEGMKAELRDMGLGWARCEAVAQRSGRSEAPMSFHQDAVLRRRGHTGRSHCTASCIFRERG